MRLVFVSFTPIYSETLHDRPFSVTSEESLRDSEPPDIFLLGTKGQDGLSVSNLCLCH